MTLVLNTVKACFFGIVLCLGLVFVVAPHTAFAVQPDEVLSDAALEKRARALSAGLRCVVCQNQSIDDSDAPLARDLRLLVRERLVAGENDEQVMKTVVDRYGEYVLLKPRFGLHTAVLWLLPFAVLGTAILVILVRQRQGRTDMVTQSASRSSALTPEEEARLASLLEGGGDPSVSKE